MPRFVLAVSMVVAITAWVEARSPVKGTPIGHLDGVVLDETNAMRYGRWRSGNRLDGYYGDGYLYSSDPEAAIEYLLQTRNAGRFELRMLYAAHANRGDSVPVTVTHGVESTKRLVNMRIAPTAGRYKSLGIITASKGATVHVRIEVKDAGGIVHADAIQLVELN